MKTSAICLSDKIDHFFFLIDVIASLLGRYTYFFMIRCFRVWIFLLYLNAFASNSLSTTRLYLCMALIIWTCIYLCTYLPFKIVNISNAASIACFIILSSSLSYGTLKTGERRRVTFLYLSIHGNLSTLISLWWKQFDLRGDAQYYHHNTESNSLYIQRIVTLS